MLSADQIHCITLTGLARGRLVRNPYTLSEREIEAIELRAAGRGNSSIGRRLGVSHAAIGKYFKKPLVRACLNRYIESGGKDLYPRPVYVDRQAKRAAEINDQRIKYFKNWLLRSFVHLGTLQAPERFNENLDIILSEAREFWADYFREVEPLLSKAEIKGFLRSE